MQANSNLEPYGQSVRRMQLAEQVLDAVSVGCYLLDSYGRFIYINRKAEALLNTNSEQLAGRTLWDISPGLTSAPHFQIVVNALQDKKLSVYEYFFADTNTWILQTVYPREAGVMVLLTEYNEMHEVKVQLQEAQRRLEAAQQIGQMGYFEWYLDTQVFYGSEEFYRIHGLQPQSDSISFEKFIALAHFEDQAGYRLQLQEGIARKRPFEITNRIVRQDGTIRLVHRRAEFLQDEKGRVNRIYGTVQDITRQCSTDLILNTMNEACYELDANFRVVNANSRALESWKKSALEVMGKWLWNLFPEYLGTPFHETLVNAFDDNVQQSAEAYCPISKKWFYIHATPAHNGLLVLLLDISQQKEAEDRITQLKTEQQLEMFKATINTQEEERKRIAESLHNGIGQLLYATKMSLDQMDLNQHDLDRHSLAEARHTAARLLADAIKESRRISHVLTPAILEDFGLKAAVEEVCRQFGYSINIKCSFEGIPRNLDKYVEVSVYRMVQELVMNIIKHARATEAGVEIIYSEQEIILTVWDNGIGLDIEYAKGKGIGLPTTYNKVKLLNGSITIGSSQGTKLKITIPYPLS